MNFFEQQDRAKKNSARLILLFLAAVFCITIAVTYVICVFFLTFEYNLVSLNPKVIFKTIPSQTIGLSFAIAVAVILCASFFKILSLSSNGGRKIADMLNAREITRSSINTNENMLLNVVEEISIASNIPAPPVYLLHDNSINAFVAGNSYEDAVIGVTQGAIKKLNREELQGVIAHEFSHMFNGDMKLNTKSIGLLYGILFISIIGTQLIKNTTSTRTNSKNGSASVPIFLIFGIVLYFIGSIGVFFGNMIKAAINRQREYLADASAVQFTRNPDGIINALKKIGYFGSKIDAPDANEFSHLYINDGIKSIFSFSTHPPLNDRIRRIDKYWDGNFDNFFAKEKHKKIQKEKSKDKIAKIITAAAIFDKINNIGNIDDARIKNTKEELLSIPKEVYYSIDNPLEAGLTIFCMLLDNNQNIKTTQIEIIKNNYENLLHVTSIVQNLLHVDDVVSGYKREDYLKIILICINSLKSMTKEQYSVFKETVNALILADEHVSWFEWNIKYIVIYQLDIYFGYTKVPSEIHKNINSIKFEIELFLSGLSYAQTKNYEKAKKIFDDAKEIKNFKNLQYIEYENITNRLLTHSLTEISRATPVLRRDILEMAVFCIKGKNGTFSPVQIESIHAISILLRLPINIK